MSLYQRVLENTSLRFIDEDTGDEFKLTELDLFFVDNQYKRLFFLYIDNSISSITSLFSVLRSKHVLVLLSPNLDEKLKDRLETLYLPSYIIDSKRQQIRGFQKTPYYFQRVQDTVPEIHSEIRMLLSTSGTTGSPKFVKLSEENLQSNAMSITTYLPITDTDVAPLNLPVYYSYGLSVLTSNALKGGKISCGNIDVLSRNFWENLNKFGYTSIAGVPFIYEMLNRIGFTKKKYPSLRYITQAGGKLQNELIRKFEEYASANNISFYVMYGQTEATARISYVPPAMLRQKIGSIGVSIPGGELFIDDKQELCYKGNNVFGGYATCPDDLKDYRRPELLHTGDIAITDSDNFFYVTGRLKRFVKLFGNRVNLDEVENILGEHFSVICKCAGNDESIVVVSDDFAGQENEVRSFLNEKLKIHNSVIKIKQIDLIPLTSNGKVDYSAILNKYEA